MSEKLNYCGSEMYVALVSIQNWCAHTHTHTSKLWLSVILIFPV